MDRIISKLISSKLANREISFDISQSKRLNSRNQFWEIVFDEINLEMILPHSISKLPKTRILGSTGTRTPSQFVRDDK